MSNESNADHIQFHATAKCFKPTLYLLLWPTERMPFGSLVKTIFFLSRSVKTIYGSPCCSMLPVHNTYVMGNPRRNIATKLSTDHSLEILWQIIKGNSVSKAAERQKISYRLAGSFEFYLNRFGRKLKLSFVQSSWPEIVNRPLATSYENLVASAKSLVALATRKAQFRTRDRLPTKADELHLPGLESELFFSLAMFVCSILF